MVLDDGNELRHHGETITSVLDRWAFDLWGITAGQLDSEAGLTRTRAWFDAVRNTYRQRPVTR